MKIEWRNIIFFPFILAEENDVGRVQGWKNVFELYSIAAQYFDLGVHYCTLITTVFITVVVVAIVIVYYYYLVTSFPRSALLIYISVKCWVVFFLVFILFVKQLRWLN